MNYDVVMKTKLRAHGATGKGRVKKRQISRTILRLELTGLFFMLKNDERFPIFFSKWAGSRSVKTSEKSGRAEKKRAS